MEISIPLFIPLLNKGDAIATPVTHFHSCIDSALFNLFRLYCGLCLTLCCRLSKSELFIVILLCISGLRITWDRKTTTLRSWLASKKTFPMKTFPKSFPVNSHFVSSPPKIPNSPKPSHLSE